MEGNEKLRTAAWRVAACADLMRLAGELPDTFAGRKMAEAVDAYNVAFDDYIAEIRAAGITTRAERERLDKLLGV